MLGQNIGTVRHDIFRLGPVGAELFDNRLRHREGGRVGGHLREIRQGRCQLDLEGKVVDCAHAQLVGGHVAGQDLAGILDRHQFHEPRIGRCQFGIDRATPRIDKVVGGHRLAVRPFGVVAQVEGVNVLGVVGGIAKGNAGLEAAVGGLVHQTFEQVTHDVAARHVFDNLRVDRAVLVQHAIGKGLVSGQLFAGYRVHGTGIKRRDQHGAGK